MLSLRLIGGLKSRILEARNATGKAYLTQAGDGTRWVREDGLLDPDRIG